MPPAQHALALPMVSPVAVRQFDVCGNDSKPRSTRTLLASIAAELRCESVVRRHERGGLLTHQAACDRKRCVGALVSATEVAVAGGDTAVRRAVDLDVVVARGWVRRSAASW